MPGDEAAGHGDEGAGYGGGWAPLLVDLPLARRLEGALAADLMAFAAAMAEREPGGGAGQLIVGGGAVTFTGPGLLGARAQGLGLQGEVSDGEVDRGLAFLRDRGAAAAVELCPLADPMLLAGLTRRGLQPSSFRDIYGLMLAGAAPESGSSGAGGGHRAGEGETATTVSEAVPGIEVEVVGSDRAEIWSDVLLGGFGYEPGPRRDRIAAWNAMMAGLPRARLLVARIDGVVVGGSNLLVHPSSAGPVASLGGTATLRGYRRQGVQLALLRARIRLAAEAGCDLVVVTADPGSTSGRNARRAGFHLAYTNVRLASPLR